MLPQNKPDRAPHVLRDDHRPGGQCRPAPAGHPSPVHLGLQRDSFDHHLDLGGAPGRANYWGQDADAGRFTRWQAATASTTTDALRAGGTVGVLGCVVKAPVHPGDLPAARFRWPACPSTRPREPPVVGPAPGHTLGPESNGWTRTLIIDLDSTICETYGLAKEGALPPRLYRRPRLSPAAGHCAAEHRRGADRPGCARAGPTPPVGAAHFLK